jgi:hypothetical protein
MKNWIRNNWNTFVVGYIVGLTFMVMLNAIDSIIIKIAILLND